MRKGLTVTGLVVISALIAVGVTCPLGCAVQPPDIIIPKLNGLKGFIAEVVEANPRIMTKTNTMQQANALYNKIDAVKMMVEEGNYMGAAEKLENDIAPKLNYCNTTRIRALSWLSDETGLQSIVYGFAGRCQVRIEDILDGLTNYNG